MTVAERLAAYREALQIAEDNYRLADYIDSTARRDRERAALRPRIEALKRKIAHYEQHDPNDLFRPIEDDEL